MVSEQLWNYIYELPTAVAVTVWEKFLQKLNFVDATHKWQLVTVLCKGSLLFWIAYVENASTFIIRSKLAAIFANACRCIFQYLPFNSRA